MRVEYTFPVVGHLRTGKNFRLPIRGRIYELRCDTSGFLSELSVTVTDVPSSAWPTVRETPAEQVKAHVNIPHQPDYRSIVRELRNLEALLGIYGVREIQTNRGKTTWIPESEQEAQDLQIRSYSMSIGDMKDTPQDDINPSELLQAVIAAPETLESEIPLNFFRKGCLDLEQERFIDAIYDFYFCLETQFGQGHTKNYKVRNAFLASADLVRSLEEEVRTFQFNRRSTVSERSYFERTYREPTTAEIIDHIVQLRGSLHHHSLKNKNRWHPDGHRRFGVDALVLHRICGNICIRLAVGRIVNKEAAEVLERTSVQVWDTDPKDDVRS